MEWYKSILEVVREALVRIGVSLVVAFPTWLVWNEVIPRLTGWVPATYWDCFLLVILSWMLSPTHRETHK